MTAIRNSPAAVRPQAPIAAPKTPAAEVSAPPPRPSSPSSAYAAAKKKLVSITGRFRAAPKLGGETMDLKSLLASLQAGPAIPSKAAATTANPNDVQRADAALKAGPTPAADHPRMQHVKDVQERLKKEGLPTDADGVHVYVVGDNTQNGHGEMVVRTIAGPAGLAQKAEVALSEKMPDVGTDRLPDEEARMPHVSANLSAKTGSATGDELKMWALDSLEAAYTQPKQELDYLVAHAPDDGQTKIVNMSWGNSEESLVAQATKAALASGDGPIIEDLNARRKQLGKPPLDLKRPEAQEEVRHAIAGHIHAAVTSPEGAKRLQTARAEATAAVAKARDAGFLPIAAAGNFFETRTSDNSRANENLVATIPGVLSVGSVGLDGKVGKTSSAGADIAAPGVDVPVGIDQRTGAAKDVSGTSFAAPYAASVAALMVKANPNITPDQIEKILESDAVTKDVKQTTRDGAGVIDPVAAVRAAKELMKAEAPAFHTSQDLDPAAKRAVHDALRKLMPTTTPAFKAAINLVNDDHFVELDVATQKNLLAGLVAHKDDPAITKDVTALVKTDGFRELGPAARARFAQNFTTLEKSERADALKLFGRKDLGGLSAPVKDAVLAAASKSPSDAATVDALAKRANDPKFQQLPADAQTAFFRAFEHQHESIEIDPQPANKAALLSLVDGAAFQKLDPSAQSRWMQALGSDDQAVRDRSYERLADTKPANLAARATALDGPDMVRTDRKVLPDASTAEPVISAQKADKRSVFFNDNGKGINPKKADVLVQTITIDGQKIEVVFPKPMPKDVPSIDLIAQGLAGLPAKERAGVQQVIVDPRLKNFMQAADPSDGRPSRVFMGGEVPDNQVEMTAMLSHETAHLLGSATFKKHPEVLKKWEAAIKADNHAVSDYATTRLQEDVAETVALYYQVKGTPEEAAFKREFPNRYAAIKDLIGD